MINKNAKLWEVPPEEFDQVVAANLIGTVNVIRNFVPHLIRRGSGVVVNFSSGWGRSAAAEVWLPRSLTPRAIVTSFFFNYNHK